MIKKSLILLYSLLTILLSACSASTAMTQTSATSPPQHWYSNVFNPSLWQTIKRGESLTYNPQQPDIAKQITFYSNNPRYIERIANNARPYLYYVYQQTKKRQMPAELALLPMVESNYSPFGISTTGATGLWQIMPGTASGFKLDINWWYDGRRDIQASTQAALDYMDYLHHYFHDWLLAIAAYNCGEGTVEKAIQHNKQKNLPTDFWSLSLPYQTKLYVPKLLALASIINNPKQYNITLPYIANKPYFTEVKMSGQIDFELIAKLADMSVPDIRLLNPGYRRFATAPGDDYALLLPINKADVFSSHLNNNAQQRVTWRHHIVTAGDTLSSIANQYHTQVTILQRVNNLNSSLIHIKQNLLIPLTNNITFNTNVRVQQGNIAEDNRPGPKHIAYVVQPKDTLASIAHRYGVTTSALCFWNHFPRSHTLHPNDTITLWLNTAHATPQSIHYTVKSGDNLSLIAHRYHVSTQALKQTNKLSNNIIHPRQQLIIPTATHNFAHQRFTPKHNNEMITHTVNNGETLSGIAYYYRVTTRDINTWNHLNNNTFIKAGKKLRIYPGTVTS